tara:strand:- start:1032 stop:1193 length:162 start_codon:yes stop_codon:yes gene_type:complete
MRIIYNIILSFIYLNLIYSQGVDFPNEPVQAPISGLALLVAMGIGLAYKKFKN